MANSPFPQLSDHVRSDLLQVFKLLSDETRFRIVLCLAQDGEKDVTTMCQILGQSQPAVSHHLGLLRMAGLLQLRRAGKHNFYSVHASRFSGLLKGIFGSAEADRQPMEYYFDKFVLTFSE